MDGVNFAPHIKVVAPDGATLVEVHSPARWEATLTQTGSYTLIVSDNVFAWAGHYTLLVSCIVGDCGRPVLRLTLTGCTECHAGDQFTVEAHWTNTGAQSVRTEIKVGLMLPDRRKSNVLGNKHLEATLPAGLDFTSNILSFAWPSGLPPGTWTLEGTLLGPELGETYSRDVNVFTVAP